MPPVQNATLGQKEVMWRGIADQAGAITIEAEKRLWGFIHSKMHMFIYDFSRDWSLFM
jgi:hypothetical protein